MLRFFTLFIFISLIFSSEDSFAQNTVGLISYNPSKALDGYNLFYPHRQPNVYLVNNCGEVVHTWEGEPGTVPGNTAYLLDDGRMVRTVRPTSVTSDRIWAGGGGATVEIRDWDNNLEWSYTLNDSLRRLHHDVAIIDTDDEFSILMLAWELKNLDEVIEAGRDTSVLATNEMWPDYIFEIDPALDSVIWEWHTWDHLIQDHDPSKSNFGIIADHPEKIDVNLDLDGMGNADWMHGNALDYDPEFDMISLSVPYFSEVFIIDHTTSTEEAASSFGGFSGIGGDLMYRWGNPQNYDQGTEEDKTLFFQHDVHFINDHIDLFDPNYGKMAIFNNRIADDYSSVGIFNPGFDMYEWTFPKIDGAFAPLDFDKVAVHPQDRTKLFSTGLSSFQYLSNGNFLITSGRFGYTFEMTPSNQIVWEYITPLLGGGPVAQGDTSLVINSNLTFRSRRFPTDFSAFDGRDLSPKGYIEQEPNTEFCDQLLAIEDLFEEYQLKLYPNPAQEMITLEWEAGKYVDVEVFNLMGQEIIEPMRLSGGRKYLNTSTWGEGIYVVRINQKEAGRFLIIR